MKRKIENIAEYILWLWQLEDFVRAFPEKVVAVEGNEDMQFLVYVKEMMHREGVIDSGHIHLAQNALQELEELHAQCLNTEANYSAAVLAISPSLTIFKSKTQRPTMSDCEACLVLLYQIMMLRLQKKEISEQTAQIQQQATQLLQYLSKTYYQLTQQQV